MSIAVVEVPGLYFTPNVLSKEDEKLIKNKYKEYEEKKQNICNQIHTAIEFGWRFIPVKVKTKDDYIGGLPDWLLNIWEKCLKNGNLPEFIKKEIPNHVLINKYPIGDGCRDHTDELKFWNNWILGISVGSGCTVEFILGDKKIRVWMPPLSMYILTEDARYKWTHGITYNNSDSVYGDIIPRDERISITFRKIHEDYLTNEVIKSVNL
jgi:hypothetical protein